MEGYRLTCGSDEGSARLQTEPTGTANVASKARSCRRGVSLLYRAECDAA